MSAAGNLIDERDLGTVELIIQRAGDRLRARMEHVEGHLATVLAEIADPLSGYAAGTILAGGKRLRPLLVLLSAEGAGEHDANAAVADGEREQALLRAAAAVELLHSATLVHDDLIDAAPLRRGHPTVAVLAGSRTAIATGDVLFSRAFAELTRNGDPEQLRALSAAAGSLAAGELLQREDAFAFDVTTERYIKRCELKTAALFEASCRLGALASAERGGNGKDIGQARRLADALGLFARRIGLAFQLLDDVLDVSGAAAQTGKSRGTDILDGTITLPLILARGRDAELAGMDLRALVAAGEVDLICERIEATGALDDARRRALALVSEAKLGLPEWLPAQLDVLLRLVADAVVDRYR